MPDLSTPDGATHEKVAITMRLLPGRQDEYKRRHDTLWPELAGLLRDAGISDYSIYLDPKSHTLFAVLWRRRDHGMEALPSHPVMRRWWDHMADLMEVDASHAPMVRPLIPMFHLA